MTCTLPDALGLTLSSVNDVPLVDVCMLLLRLGVSVTPLLPTGACLLWVVLRLVPLLVLDACVGSEPVAIGLPLTMMSERSSG